MTFVKGNVADIKEALILVEKVFMEYEALHYDENRIKFNDGKELYPEKFESTQQFDRKDFGDHGGNSTVWLPTDGGKKYHSKSNCSSMNNPVQATESEAINRGFSKCGKCW